VSHESVTASGPNGVPQPGAVIPGWYGKLPTLGDFASRRLAAEFVHAWDAWLQHVLQAMPQALGEGWLQSYLTTPIWRFVLLPGLAGPSGWAGVLMPSVDRVGRYFPLTVALELTSRVALARAVFTGADWFAGLEDAALAMLAGDRGPDDLDDALVDRQLDAPRSDDVEPSLGALCALPSTEAFERVARTRALAAWSRAEGWRALWWTRGRVDGEPMMLASASLPTVEEFARLLESGQPSAPAISGA
jgi:type VI secretion system protein ImpM